ncbi:MAG: TonB-dependent receptor [Sphingomonas bacterium]|uniref:TonB-dependent receptor plug domain-containing protein n=1 Tax=Sphingomonas bacterium TaxID=1895847 RepID=UPI002635A7B4|nr:TonB-dependent receptor [Sphingomonas bacterium]MDB5704499.1 TonB-dependent receptor [Sphingomonas bacterium]
MNFSNKALVVAAQGVSLVALLAAANPAFAQAAPATTPTSSPAAEQSADAPADAVTQDVIVTGTRVSRGGFTAPTPMTVLGIEELNAKAPANIANVVNDLPQLVPGVTPATTIIGVGGGTGGANILNLRGLGTNRTLVLLNGNRVVPSTITGGVDVNLMPQGLIKRVDVVTGGASAAWGSDAVAGVVNFVLDTNYEGLKGNIQAGSSFRGDAGTATGNLTFGTSFGGGKGHFIIDVSGSHQGGIAHYSDRPWYKGYKIVTNPAYVAGNGQPQRLVSTADFLVASAGGVVTTGPNAFITQFGPDGSPIAFDPGAKTSPYKIGGTPNDISASYQLLVPVDYASVFSRASYEFSDNITGYVEGSYSASRTVNTSVPYPVLGTLTIAADNAYLPASLVGTTFKIGKTFESLGAPIARNQRSVARGLAGLNGNLGGSWKWNAYYQYGVSHILNQVSNDPITANVARATDAVRSGGQIVCRSTLTNPTDGCQPLNPFGTAPATAAAIGYVTATSAQHITLQQHVAALSIQGEPFSLWAGPVSLAAGAEYRRESYSADADALSIASVFWVGNYKPGSGSYNVKEAFGELVVPLLRNVPLFKAVDLDVAGRVTNYSTSGTVATYKAGLTWDLSQDIRLRGTHSRDIRAPNLNDLFLGGQVNTATLSDTRLVNGVPTIVTVNAIQVIQGNPALVPEIANADTFGVVIHPRFIPGLSASVDYYRTSISGAITSLSSQQILNNCNNGQTGYCAAVIRDTAGNLTRVNVSGFNANSEKLEGIDYELAYTTPLSAFSAHLPGRITLRVLATNTLTRTITALGGTTNNLGMIAANLQNPTKWRWSNSFAYEVGPSRTQISMRRIGGGVYDNTYTSGVQIDNNNIAGATYFDLSQSFKIKAGDHGAEFYGVVENLFDRAPPVAAAASFLYPGTSVTYFDTIGRRFRIGFRFNY